MCIIITRKCENLLKGSELMQVGTHYTYQAPHMSITRTHTHKQSSMCHFTIAHCDWNDERRHSVSFCRQSSCSSTQANLQPDIFNDTTTATTAVWVSTLSRFAYVKTRVRTLVTLREYIVLPISVGMIPKKHGGSYIRMSYELYADISAKKKG